MADNVRGMSLKRIAFIPITVAVLTVVASAASATASGPSTTQRRLEIICKPGPKNTLYLCRTTTKPTSTDTTSTTTTTRYTTTTTAVDTTTTLMTTTTVEVPTTTLVPVTETTVVAETPSVPRALPARAVAAAPAYTG